MRHRRLLLTVPTAAALLVAITACSGTGPASTGQNAGGSGGPSASAQAGAASSAPAASGPIDTCTLVPPALVAKVMGIDYTQSFPDPQGGGASECKYDTKGSALSELLLMIEPSGGKEDSSDDQQAIVFLGEKPLPFPGVGDSAYEAPKGSDARIEKAYGALWGDTYITVGGPVAITDDEARRLLQAAHDALH